MKNRDKCACCGNKKFNTVFDFGEIPLAGSFPLEKDRHNINTYPLSIIMCPDIDIFLQLECKNILMNMLIG